MDPYKEFDNPGDDFDGDGYTENENDCDDQDPAIHPGADELCNGDDDDCDELIDESATDMTAWYFDGDGDGYGLDATEKLACEAPSDQFVSVAGDCNDTAAHVNPNAPEVCDGGTDEDCDGLVDMADDSVTGDATWYRDRDRDGHGDATEFVLSCETLPGYSLFGDDCDDASARVHPDHAEECDGVDNDCDGRTDDEDDDVTDPATWHADADGDGAGNENDFVQTCEAPSGHVAAPADGAFDCDETNADVFPGAVETCNEIDDDCDGLADEGVTTAYYADGDGDGHGDVNQPLDACTAPAGHVLSFDDCDDTRADTSPSASEVCDGVDNDCDGFTDEPDATDAPTWYLDADGDGYGDATRSFVACTQPAGHVAQGTDCDDNRPAVHPAGVETCATAYDDNCDGDANDEDATGCTAFHRDDDGDGHGTSDARCLCTAEGAHTSTSDEDCDDTLAAVNPFVPEDCDTAYDDNCSGDSNDTDAAHCTFWYLDSDGDGYGLTADSLCRCAAADLYTASATGDCNDADSRESPGGTEICADGLDNDCSGAADGGDAVDAQAWYADTDGDGFGDPTAPQSACTQPSGHVANGTDCDDGRDGVYPGQTETCGTTFDDDCIAAEDGAVDCTAFYLDADGDGYGTADTRCLCVADGDYRAAETADCDDADAAISPGGAESCASPADDNCDGVVDEAGATGCSYWYYDGDGDGYGLSTGECLCATTGYYTASLPGDCDDTDAATNPGYTNCGLSGTLSSSSADGYFTGLGGNVMYPVGDINGDGYDDLGFGNPTVSTVSTYAGAAYVVLGPATGAHDLTVDADLTVLGDTLFQEFGTTVGGTGDINDDGYDDLVVGAKGAGATYLFLGPLAGTLSSANADLEISAGGEGAWITGDMNGDGVGELMYAASLSLAFGPIPSGGGFQSDEWYSGVFPSYWVSPLGLDVQDGVVSVDLDADGVEDVCICLLDRDNGKADIRLSDVSSPGFGGGGQFYIRTSSSSGNDDFFCSAIAVAGDTNADGYQDLLIAAFRHSTSFTDDVGAAYLFQGPFTDHGDSDDAEATVFGSLNYSNVGAAVAGPGDVDADGYDDVLIGGSDYSSSGQPTALFYGPLAGSLDITAGDAIFSEAFNRARPAGDTNADGYADILLTDANGDAFLHRGGPR
jgi:hypothetical protein